MPNGRGALPQASPLISVVEDDDFVRQSIGRLMRSFGYAVETFPSAAAFLAFPRLAEIACLITDIAMPGMTGIELYRQLVDSGRPIPTIMITGHPDDATQAKMLNEGVVCYLKKPFGDQEMLRCVRLALGAPQDPSDDP